jgi:glycosyltransferase involved in cell wall biosynthesis
MQPNPRHGAGKYRFVVPDLDGPSTGGTVYNRELTRALSASGASVDVLGLEAAERALALGEPGNYFVDTLFLNELPRLDRLARENASLTLLAHYLPSLVRYGSDVARSVLSAEEARALEHTRRAIAPSAFMRRTLERLSEPPPSVAVAEPGRLAAGVAPQPSPGGTLRVVVVAHLVPGKGVDRLLSALAASLEPRDRLTLNVIGSLTQDPAHAAACRVFATAPALRERATLLGELSPAAVNQRIAECDLLLSASSMESFGIVLAEARTLGVPIIARVGGNVENLVQNESGGELVADAVGVAAACVALVRDPEELVRRRGLARARALAPYGWSDAAARFTRAAAELESGR